MTTPRQAPYVWTTWITRLIAGEVHCEWAAWFRTHHIYDKLPNDFDLAKWAAEHSAMVRARAAGLRAAGYSVFVEEQNAFRLRGQLGVTLAGKPDIVALRDDAVQIVECKTGLSRNADQIQALVYLLILPYVRPAWKHKVWSGSVQYRDTVVNVSATAVDTPFKTLFRCTMAQVGGVTPLQRSPSYAECCLCDISRHDCPQRIDSPPLEIDIEHDLF